jgi:hypothetical protein
MIEHMGSQLDRDDEPSSISRRTPDRYEFPDFPELAANAFAPLLLEVQDLTRGRTELVAPDVLALLALAGEVHRARPYSSGAVAGESARALVSIGERISEHFGSALGFIPRPHRRQLGEALNFDPGRVAERCEALFSVYLVRTGVPLGIAARHVRDYALLLSLWETLRHEELSRLERAAEDGSGAVGVILSTILRGGPDTDVALDLLSRRYLHGKALRTVRAAYRQTPSVAERVDREEAEAEVARLLAENLAPIRALPAAALYAKVLDKDSSLCRLPASIHRDARNFLARLKAKRRTLPPDVSLESTDSPMAGIEGVVLGECLSDRNLAVGWHDGPGNAPGHGAEVQQFLDRVEQQLGPRGRRVLEVFLLHGPILTAVEVAGVLGWNEKTVRRMLQRIMKHPGLAAALSGLKST